MEKIRVSLRGQYVDESGAVEEELTIMATLIEVKEEQDQYVVRWVQAGKERLKMNYKADQETLIKGITLSVPEKLKPLRKAPIPVKETLGISYPIRLEKGSDLTIIFPKVLLSSGCGDIDEGV